MVTQLTVNNLLKTSVKYLNLMEIPISVLLQKYHTISFLKNFSGLTMLLCLLQGEKKSLWRPKTVDAVTLPFKNGVEFLRFLFIILVSYMRSKISSKILYKMFNVENNIQYSYSNNLEKQLKNNIYRYRYKAVYKPWLITHCIFVSEFSKKFSDQSYLKMKKENYNLFTVNVLR